MANLILKPSTGGVLKIQNDAGNVDALTVSTAGNLTAAGNTTLSGTANNLGTVTAGSIAGGSITSATTFPAGHMVGFGKAAGTGQPSGGYTAGSYESLDNATITYTPKAQGNILLLNASISSYLDNRSRDAYYTWYAGSTNVANTASGSGGMGLSVDNLKQIHEYGGSANDDFPIGGDVTGWWIAQDTSSTAFSVYWKANESVLHHVIVCTLMEIQQ
jgi:hypothetical protein